MRLVVITAACGWAKQGGSMCFWLQAAELLALLGWLFEQGRRMLAQLCNMQSSLRA